MDKGMIMREVVVQIVIALVGWMLISLMVTGVMCLRGYDPNWSFVVSCMALMLGVTGLEGYWVTVYGGLSYHAEDRLLVGLAILNYYLAMVILPREWMEWVDVWLITGTTAIFVLGAWGLGMLVDYEWDRWIRWVDGLVLAVVVVLPIVLPRSWEILGLILSIGLIDWYSQKREA